MQQQVFRRFRIIEVAVVGVFAVLATAIALNPRASKGALIFVCAFAALAIVMFEWRLGRLRRRLASVRESLEAVSRRDLENASVVAEREVGTLANEFTSPLFARMVSGRAISFYSRGTWQGDAFDVGTAVVSGRDGDVLISHVLVETRELPAPLRMMTKGTFARFVRMGVSTSPVTTGDAAFDESWVVDSTPELARATLDAELRSTLASLPAKLGWMEAVTIEVVRSGVMLRWPGELTVESAAFLRDLAIRVRDRVAASRDDYR